MSNIQGRGTLSGILAVLFWSFTAPVIASASGVDPFLYVGFEHALGVMVFLVKWLAIRENPIPELKSAPLWFLVAGLVGISVHELTWVAALQEAPPLEAMLIIYLWPVLVVVFTAVAQGRKVRWFHFVGCALGFGGIVIMLAGRGLALGHLTLLPGHLWGLVSALTWSVFAAICARYHQLSTNLLSIVFLLSSVINMAIWFFVLGAPPAPFHSLVIVGIASVLITSAYVLWDYGMKVGNAQLIGVISFLTPVLGAFYLGILGMAALTPYLAAALVCVMLGIGVTKYGERLPS